MKRYNINPRVGFKQCKSKSQQCFWCGEKVGNNIAISINNSTDSLALKKNVWLHPDCLYHFCYATKAYYQKHIHEMIAEFL